MNRSLEFLAISRSTRSMACSNLTPAFAHSIFMYVFRRSVVKYASYISFRFVLDAVEGYETFLGIDSFLGPITLNCCFTLISS